MSMRAMLAWLALVACAATHAAPVVEPGAAPPPSAVTEDVRCPPAAAQPTTQDEVLEGMRQAVDSGLLWKATKAGRIVYLYGTIHVAQRSWMFPGPHVMKAVLASDTIALELDPGDPDIVARLQKAILRRPDAPALPEALQRRLLAQMAAACIAPDTFAAMRPEMQAVSIEVLEGRQFGLYPDFGIDTFLAGLGRGLKKPVRSLETPESQARLLVSDDPAETVRTVDELMDELEGGKGPQLLQRLAGDWQRGDLDDLGAYASWCECLDTPQQRADFVKLVDERNPLMADKIVQWHAQGKSLFVAVGTLHMIGPAGLPALLKARGFEVERVAFTTP
jgi:uncharacterized protein YbaP (TraB family)